MHQSLQGATFHIEHVIPRVHGGSSDSNNLAWPVRAAICTKRIARVPRESETAAVAFFDPRSDVWTEHFEWDDIL